MDADHRVTDYSQTFVGDSGVPGYGLAYWVCSKGTRSVSGDVRD